MYGLIKNQYFIAPFLLFLTLLCGFIIYNPVTFKALSPFQYHSTRNAEASQKDELGLALAEASTENKAVIIAVVNKAYVEGDDRSMLDLFLDSFWHGENTRGLVDNLLLVNADQASYERCRFLRLHCYRLETDGVKFDKEEVYMSDEFIKMMWSRTLFLGKYSSVAMTSFLRSNKNTVRLFDLWYARKDKSAGQKEQDVLNGMLHGDVFTKLGLRVGFLDTLLFSGFCQDSKDIRAVTTVHANCCRTIRAKITDLSAVIDEWKRFKRSAINETSSTFRNLKHEACAHSWGK
ncbi:Nucleotide-diphospho-sugar transferase protein [Salix suchowensis]|nr:Nucleotide-diphospho-sugar transferase protein [Salix suchowensis]